MLWCSQFVADLFVEMEELELHYRCRDRANFRKIGMATISVWMIQKFSLLSFPDLKQTQKEGLGPLF